jgi:hypothetical protein
MDGGTGILRRPITRLFSLRYPLLNHHAMPTLLCRPVGNSDLVNGYHVNVSRLNSREEAIKSATVGLQCKRL